MLAQVLTGTRAKRISVASSPYTKVTRGERLLNMLTDKAGLSPTGRDFLIAALDPMHDTQLTNLEGWPDVETAASVVRCITKSVTISQPVGITGDWNLHVVAFPWQSSCSMLSTSRSDVPYGNNVLNYGGASQNLGGVMAFGTQTDVDLSLVASPTVGQIALLDTSYEGGASRIVGLGIECTNTTASLNRQGTCTVYRQPQSHTTDDIYSVCNIPTGAAIKDFSGHMVRSPPLNVADAMLIPGSRQWKAEDGCYLVTPFVGQDNPPQLVRYTQPLIPTVSNSEDVVTTSGAALMNRANLLMPQMATNVGSTPAISAALKIAPIHMPGAIFSGLSATSTITINVNYYVETFPTKAQASILPLATPSAIYDPLALELFSKALSSLPVGVKAGENGLGDWFAGVIKEITNYATPALLALGQPGFAAISQGANTLSRGYLASQSPTQEGKRKKKNKNKAQNREMMNQIISAQAAKKGRKQAQIGR